MSRTTSTLSRVAGLALVLTGAALFAAGQASANDRAVVISCTGQTAGTWTVAVTFSSVEVRADRPVQVTLGSDSATLTEPSLDGTVTLHQNFGPDQTSASLTWSIVRLDYQNTGVLHLDQPAECRETTTTAAPPSSEVTPPSTEATPTTSPGEAEFASSPSPSVKPAVQALPETGRPTMPLLALGAGAVIGGLGLVGVARRRPEQA